MLQHRQNLLAPVVEHHHPLTRLLASLRGTRSALRAAVLLFVAGLPAALLTPTLTAADLFPPAQSISYIDPVTHLSIRELTAPPLVADNLYFHVSNFTADNRSLLFVGQQGNASRLYRADPSSGTSVPITSDPKINARSACPDPLNPDRVYLMRGPELLALNLQDLSVVRVGEIPPPHLGGFQQPTLSGDGKQVAVTKQRDANTWEIGLIDVASGAYRTVITQGFRIGHVQHSPTDPIIFYVWETGGFAPQRTWLVNQDGSANRPFYFRTDPKSWLTPLKEWITHEAWVPSTGDMTMVNDKLGILLVAKDGSARLVREGNYWHAAASHDGKRLVIDDAQGRLWLSEVETGNIQLLATGLRDSVKAVHAHASFDRHGRYVQFHTGRSNETVALLDLTQLPKPRSSSSP